MGVVYRAYDLRLKRPVALKLVAPSLALDERFRERFARESELVMSLEHPNVVPIYDAGDVDGRLYLAMRLVDGTNLGTLLRAEGALEPGRAMAICAQVASALDATHARGLVHRDVKPSNVLLDSSEHVYLADFGLTRRLDDQMGPGEDRSIGTPAYLAPEQIDGVSVDGRADVYSLGCLLYECLTGERVFPRGSQLAEAWAHLEEEPLGPAGDAQPARGGRPGDLAGDGEGAGGALSDLRRAGRRGRRSARIREDSALRATKVDLLRRRDPRCDRRRRRGRNRSRQRSPQGGRPTLRWPRHARPNRSHDERGQRSRRVGRIPSSSPRPGTASGSTTETECRSPRSTPERTAS